MLDFPKNLNVEMSIVTFSMRRMRPYGHIRNQIQVWGDLLLRIPVYHRAVEGMPHRRDARRDRDLVLQPASAALVGRGRRQSRALCVHVYINDIVGAWANRPRVPVR